MSLETFDEFLGAPSQRDLTRALLASLYASRGLFVAHGHAEAAARLVAQVATHFPDPQVHVVMAQRHPLRAVTVPGAGEAVRATEPPDATLTQVVRSLLRQDPDVIAITQLDAEVGPLALQAAFTGHQVLVGSAAADLDGVLAVLVGAEEQSLPHARAALGVVAELNLEGRLLSVRRAGDGALHEVARLDERGSVTLAAERLGDASQPARSPPPALAPPLAALPKPTGTPRSAWLVRTGAEGPHSLGTSDALRPEGTTWPLCAECQAPLSLVVDLLLPLPSAPSHPAQRAQLFVCAGGGCDVQDERAAGVLAELLPTEGLVRVRAPDTLEPCALEPGAISELVPFDDDRADPLRCDKVGGWPNFEQGEDWPLDDDGAPMALLFQFAEGTTLEGGVAPTWNFLDACLVPGTSPRRVVDPNAPSHFPSLLTGEAVGFLFLGRARLAFRWQTG